MNDTLLHFYEQELAFFRNQAEDFAARYPAAAAQLRLEKQRSTDPHVERMIEAFALLTGRISQKLDDDLPEVSHALLENLYPHYLRPFPSMGIVELQPDVTNVQPTGLLIPRHTRLVSQRIGRVSCQFRTAYDVTLWPLQITQAQWQLAPFSSALAPPPDCAAILRIQFQAQNGSRLVDLALEQLRLCVSGERSKTALLYELLLNHVLKVEFRALDGQGQSAIVLPPSDVLSPVGFAEAEELLPYSRQTFIGQRTLGEFFNFPQKYSFIDLGGWQQVRAADMGTRVEAVFYLDRDAAGMEQEVDEQTFRLGATPIVNLFPKAAEPIRLTHNHYEYRVVPDVQRQKDVEVYSIERVISASPGATREFRPFYDFRRYGDRVAERDRAAFWTSARRPSQTSEEVTTDVFLQFVDERFDPHLPSDAVLVAHTLCTNGDLPYRLQQSGHPLVFQLETASPVKTIQTLVSPTPTLRPALRRRVHWRLIEHLSSQHWSFSDNQDSLPALQEILRLYCLADEQQHPQAASMNQQLIDSLLSIKTRRVLGRVGGPTDGDFVRGLETTLEIDEDQCCGVSVLLLASVLERFLSASVSINSFHQLVAQVKQGQRVVRRWPPRAGETPLL